MEEPDAKRRKTNSVDVVIVGCGTPKKSMGWLHLSNMLAGKIPGSHISAIVEPWLLGEGRTTPNGKAFAEEMGAASHDFLLVQSVAALPKLAKPTLAVIAGRTADAPQLFEQVVERGFTHVYLEKPGAETADGMQRLCRLATQRGVSVVMGYICNVSKYVRQALVHEAELKTRGEIPDVEICRVNHYTAETLGECFSRNSEGIVRNMLGHDLALAVTFWGVRADTMCEVSVDRMRTSFEEHGSFHDFSKLAFVMHLVDGRRIAFMADRCGGDWCGVRVGTELFKLPSEAERADYERLRQDSPDVMPYFIRMRVEYVELLSATVEHILAGRSGPPRGAMSLETGHQVLLIADKLDGMLATARKRT